MPRRTFQSKITRVVMTTCGVVLLLATGALLLDEYISYRKDTANRLRIMARIVATQSSAALLFKDSRAGEEILSALRAEPDLVAAATYTTDNQIFVRYLRSDASPQELPAAPRKVGSHFRDGAFELFEPIVVDQKPVGTFYLRSELHLLSVRMAWSIVIALAVLATTALIARIMATRLVSLVTQPIFRLEQMANKITFQRDYGVRADQANDDEVGRLVHAFNEMVAQIQSRDDALRKAQAELEERVRARTDALQTTLREMESFTYTISHDLRAPLRAMTGFSRALLDDYGPRLDQTGTEYLARIASAARKMDALILDYRD